MNIIKAVRICIVIPAVFCLVFLVTIGFGSDCDERNEGAGGATTTGSHDRTKIDKVEPLVWASSNPETIARNGEIALTVTGGKSPYTWTVQGSNFSLVSQEPTDGNNQLNAGPSACGAATIKVTGSSGLSVTGYIRCTSGKWVRVGSDRSCYNGAFDRVTICTQESGKMKYVVRGESCTYSYCTKGNPCKYPTGRCYCANVVCNPAQPCGYYAQDRYSPGISIVWKYEWQCQ